MGNGPVSIPGTGPGAAAGTLSPWRRSDDIGRLTAGVDLLVIGGGVTGAGAALDAATRGLKVGIVEAQDWAAGSSSRSSKLVHGGLRYLQMLDFHLVHEALAERALLLGYIAPHLVRPLPVMYPLRKFVVERAYVGAGVALYDLMALGTGKLAGRGPRSGAPGGPGGPGARLPIHRHLGKRAALRAAPGLRANGLSGAVMYYDAQVDDARFVVELVRTAAAHGAVPVSRAGVVGFIHDGARVVGATVKDAETGDLFDIPAKVVLVATGPWTEETQALAGQDHPVRVRPSKGVHIVVPRELVECSTALVLRTRRSVLFVLPWGDHWLIGTTDTDWAYSKGRPLANAQDVAYLINEVNTVLARPLAAADVEAVYAGLRPLVAGPTSGRPHLAGLHHLLRSASSGGTTRLSREHFVGSPAPGAVAVSGGKYTTYRVMAADAVDACTAQGGLRAAPSCSRHVQLLGARGWQAAAGTLGDLGGLAWPAELPASDKERLLGRYGALVHELARTVRDDERLAAPLEGLGGYLRAEVVYAVTHEGARHLDDVMARRLRAAMTERDGAVSAATATALLMAPLLGWDERTVRSEVDDYARQTALRSKAASAATEDAEAARWAAEVPSLLPDP